MNLIEKYERILGAKTEVLTEVNTKYNEYKNRAKKKGIEFSLTFQQFDFLVKKDCFYCKIKTPDKPMGVDRIDNGKGYSVDNVAPCCWECNRAKSDMSRIEFYEYRERFNQKKKERIPNPNKNSFRRYISE